MIRIPDPGRFELRLADGSANPYLAPAAIVEAGLDGIDNQRDPGPPLDVNVYRNQKSMQELRHLPKNLLDALDCLDTHPILKAGLGEEFARAFIRLKRAEWNDYASRVSAWEVEHTLDC